MKTIGNKISYSQTAEKLLVNISGKGTQQQITLLTIWLALWTLGGIVVISQLFLDYPREEKMYLSIWLAFWLYFEWRVYYVLRWRKQGVEIVKIENGVLSYSREINGLGKVKTYQTEHIRNLQVDDFSDKQFQKVFYNSYWVTGGECIIFYFNGTEVRFGMQLAENDARQLKKVLDKAIQASSTTPKTEE